MYKMHSWEKKDTLFICQGGIQSAGTSRGAAGPWEKKMKHIHMRIRYWKEGAGRWAARARKLDWKFLIIIHNLVFKRWMGLNFYWLWKNFWWNEGDKAFLDRIKDRWERKTLPALKPAEQVNRETFLVSHSLFKLKVQGLPKYMSCSLPL